MHVNRTPEYYLTIAREQNISRAAEKLFISQSSLSQHLAKLEAELGARLFDRTKNPLELTEAGKLYKSYLESTMFLYQRFEADLSDMEKDKRQTVSIGCGTWRGSLLIPQILPEFLRTQEQALVNLNEYPVSELLPKVQSGQLDFVIMNAAPDTIPRDLVCDIICYERILLVARYDMEMTKELIQAAEPTEDVISGALGRERLITLNNRLTVGRTVENYLEMKRIAPRYRLKTTNNSTALGLTAAGMGYCFMVETGLEEILKNPEMTLFDMHAQELTIPLAVIYRRNSYLAPMTESLIDTVRAYYLQMLERSRQSRKIIDLGKKTDY